MILSSLFRHKTRTLLTVVGVAIGVMAIVALGGLSEGLSQAYGSLAGGSKADMLVAQEEAVDIIFSAVDEEVGEGLAGMSGVDEVTPMIYTAAATQGVPYFIVFGYDPQGYAIEHFKVVEGRALSARSPRSGGTPLLLGRAAAEDLDKQVGDTIRVYQSVYRVVGIYETGQPIEDGAAVVSVEEAQMLSQRPQQVNAFLLKLRDLDSAERVRQRIGRRFDDLTATLSSEFAENQQTLDFVNGFTWAVSFLAILIGGVGVMNTLLMSVFERTREFGVLRATGWERLRVLGIVLAEAVTLCGIGGLVGAGLGVTLLWALEQLPLAGGFLTAEVSPLLLARGLGVALVLGLVGGAYPAWRASGLAPAEAMRSEGGSNAGATRLKVGWVSLRNLLRQPTRTGLTLVGIGIAIMAVISLRGLGQGITEQMEAFAGSGVHLVGIEADASIDLSTIDQDKVRRIDRLPQVRHAEGFLTGYAQVGDLPYFVVFGYRPRGQMIRDFAIVEGERLVTSRQMIIGRVAADNLGAGVGDTLRVFESTFRIVGIYETGVPFEDGGGVISLRAAQNLFGQPRKVSFLGIQVVDPLQAEQVAQRIEERFPDISLSQASEFSENVVDLQMMRNGTTAIALLALLVGSAGMTNTMVMSVFERTQEIGVLRALGWSRLRVVWMILRESIVLGLLGGLVGVVSGVGMIEVINLLPFFEGIAEATFSLELFAQALFTALVLGGLGGIYPAWRASQMKPVEALRYE